MPEALRVNVADFPLDALPLLVADLSSFGAEIEFEVDRCSGVCITEAGRMKFRHDREGLTVEVIEDRGHFPRSMVIGGIRQTIQEAAERFRRSHASN
jgi:hypothetical protein